MKKIYIQKTDLAPSVIDKLLSTHETEVVIYIPKDSALLNDPKSFKLIKRESSALKKNVTIESVCQDVLDAASFAGLDVADAVFSRKKNNKFADIMPSKKSGGTNMYVMKGEKLHDGRDIGETHVTDAVEVEEEKEEAVKAEREYLASHNIADYSFFKNGFNNHKKTNETNDAEEKTDAEEVKQASYSEIAYETDDDTGEVKKMSFVKFVVTLGVFVVLVGGAYLSFFILPKANVEVTLKEMPYEWAGNISGSASISSVSAASVPIQIFKTSKSGVFKFIASGEQEVHKKASGKITIWNAYSSDPQLLVKNTRFTTADGKVYRLTSAITVPGAKISEGQINASSIQAAAEADAVGESYNIGPSEEKLKIPGFQGTAKYNGFYGVFKDGVSGGFNGVMKVATDADLAKAKEESHKNVEDALNSDVTMNMPSGFTAVPDGKTTVVSREGITADPDAKGEFSYGISIETKVLAVRENDIVSLATSAFTDKEGVSLTPKSVKVTYNTPTVDWTANKATIPVSVSGSWTREFDAGNFRQKIAGENYDSFRASIASIAGAENVKSELWPFFIRFVPKDQSKINITVK